MHKHWMGLVVTGLAAIASLVAWPYLPEHVVTHWNASGVPNGYSPRWLAATLLPAIIVGVWGLAQIFPKIDPRSVNYARFIDTYWLVMNAILVFMGAVHAVILGNGVGWALPVEKLVPAGVGLLFAMLGNYLSRVQPNWFLGIRTPWTLSSDKVWRKTHRIGGALFVVGGIGMVAIAFLPPAIAFHALVAIVVLVAGVPVVLSYIFWRKEHSGLTPPVDHG